MAEADHAAAEVQPAECPPPTVLSKAQSTPSYLQSTSAQAEGGINTSKSPKERAAEKRAQAEKDNPTTLMTSSPSTVRRANSAASTGSKKKKKEEPAAPLSWKDKGFSLSKAFNKAKWGISLAKAFAPNVELAARNRVQVGVRFRPMSDTEEKRGEVDLVKKKGATGQYLDLEAATAHVTITNPRPPSGQEAKVDMYAFDQLYSGKEGTKKVFEDLALPLVHYLLEGFNGTIFAYGQTGSGKTHSIMGNPAEPGVVPRCAEAVFKLLGKSPGGGWALKASYLQIYREVLHDLLSNVSLEQAQGADRDHKKDLRIRRAANGIVVDNLSEIELKDAAALTAIIDHGNKKRATSATLMNAASSRSHAVVILNLYRTEPVRHPPHRRPPHRRARVHARSSRVSLRAAHDARTLCGRLAGDGDAHRGGDASEAPPSRPRRVGARHTLGRVGRQPQGGHRDQSVALDAWDGH